MSDTDYDRYETAASAAENALAEYATEHSTSYGTQLLAEAQAWATLATAAAAAYHSGQRFHCSTCCREIT